MEKQNIRTIGNAGELRQVIPALKHARQYLAFFSNPEALAEHVGQIDRDSAWFTNCWNDDSGFRGTETMQGAIDLALSGWPEGAERASKLRDRINAANPTGPRVIRWDVAGAVASVPRALAGNPLNMRRIDTAKLRRRPVITLLSDMSAHCGINKNALTNRAAVVAAVVDAIEAAGYSAHILGLGSTFEDDLAARCVVTLKESDQPADIGRLAFGLGHVAMWRRLMFAIFGEDKFTRDLCQHLGHPQTLGERDAGQDTYVLPSVQNCESLFLREDDAATKGLAHLIKSLRAQGCPAFPEERAAA